MNINIPKDMDIPERRRELKVEDVRWLLRNLAISNSQHPEFERVMSDLKNASRAVNKVRREML